jgi:hypothetical protein
MASQHAPLEGHISLMETDTDAFDFGLDHNEPAPAVKRKETYEEIMGIASSEGNNEGGGNKALSSRLTSFREWLDDEAKVIIHSYLCVVNGEATDGTKNAPILSYGPPPGVNSANANSAEGRIGMIDGEEDQALYDRTMGCCVRATKEIKKDDVLVTVPRTSMISPDLVASSDAGRAVLACCEAAAGKELHFWDAFENTTICERKLTEKIGLSNGTQLLVKILQERKKAETVGTKSLQTMDDSLLQSGGISGLGKNKASLPYNLAPRGTISTRAPVLAFLIHQRFSESVSPEVSGYVPEITEEMEDSRNGLSCARRINRPSESPASFGPYARTLPSAVPLPLCWKRNELALLAGCVPGIQPLQEVAGMTLQLASEFASLVEAGILHRFPSVFPRGLITWERWVWAASVYTSRALPSSCYLDNGDTDAHAHKPEDPELFQSNPDVWDELGVMIPFLDMLNHETESAQVTWQPRKVERQDEESNEDPHPPRAISHKRIKKGSELYCNYGAKSNQILILQYGFGLINNTSDEVRAGWGLADGVGKVKGPEGYSSNFNDADAEMHPVNSDFQNGGTEVSIPKKVKKRESIKYLVYESAEASEVNEWWSEARLSLLEREALLGESFLNQLSSGKKMITVAFNDGSYHPGLLSAAVVATMDDARVRAMASLWKPESKKETPNLTITKTHQEVLREYLAFFFTRKTEKLLQSLNNGLKGHFGDVKLWTSLSEGGLAYSSTENLAEGWNKFFEGKAYFTSVAVEKHFYPLSPESCVLALYDGHLRALQTSIDGLSTKEKFSNGVLRQLEDLGFKLLPDDELTEEEIAAMAADVAVKAEENESVDNNGEAVNGKGKEKSKSKSRRRNRKRSSNGNAAAGVPSGGDRPPAVKLHIGNLAYCTLASDLFEYFAATYGRESVLECHIPTERESGRSRGFGFVTMPESSSMQALQPGKKHEVHGRILKIAQSNSAGAANRNRGPSINAIVSTDRCARCGYRPRYCVCKTPDIPAFNGATGRPFHDDIRGPEPDAIPKGDPDYDHYGGSYQRERVRESFSISPGRHRSDSRGHRERDYDRYDRDFDRHYRSRSRSYSPRGRDKDRDRSRRRSRESDRGRDRDRDRPRSRDRRRSWERSSRHSRSRSPGSDRSRSPRRDRDLDHERRGSDAKLAPNPPGARDISESELRAALPVGTSSERKRDRESRRTGRSRSRSRGKSGKRKRNSKKEGKKHARDCSPH